jgi:cell division protein FtsZ
VLFNVTGGYDMSMSEIQEAAEIITSAVAPDANIIFGATLKPELEDELIITVIATGFDSAYFHEQAAQLEAEAPSVTTSEVEAINMDLDQTDAAATFADDTTHDIWNTPPEDDDESDTPAFLRRRKKNKETEE